MFGFIEKILRDKDDEHEVSAHLAGTPLICGMTQENNDDPKEDCECRKPGFAVFSYALSHCEADESEHKTPSK